MNHPELSQLYAELTTGCFTFIPSGRYSLQDVYRLVKSTYPKLCDDTYLCGMNCKGGTANPEWQHRVRAAIWTSKDQNNYVKRHKKRGSWVFGKGIEDVVLAEEAQASSFTEGHVTRITINRYERNPEARLECIEFFGYKCKVCSIELKDIYGPVATALIHVHHLNPISLTKENTEIDPTRDLVPVCPNCHSIIHLRNPPFTIDEVKELMNSKSGSQGH